MLRSAVYNVTFYIVTVGMVVLGSPLMLGPRSWAMAALALHARICCWLLKVIVGTRLEVRGREHLPAGAALIASKHQSAWDTFGLVPIFHDPALIMKSELRLIPFYGWFSMKFGMIFVRREKRGVALRRLIADAKNRAAAGRHVLIFPEGTRRSPGEPPDYKPGVTALYDALGIACVPVALNSGLFWPRRSFARKPGTIVVEILEPIPHGLPRRDFLPLLQSRIETATARLVAEGEASMGCAERGSAMVSR
jgi:1-acyl-sn-glycerol-3-phosphate acyltransferase